MKKILLAGIVAAILSATSASKAQAQFAKANIELLSYENLNIAASTILSETPLYDKQGNFVGSVKRYDGSNLPTEISKIMSSQFHNYSVIGVEEVTIPSEKSRVYYVHINNDKKVETVKVSNGEAEVIKQYKKG